MWSCWRANAPCLHMLALFSLLPEPQMALYFWLMGLLPSYGSAHTALSLRDQLDGDLGLTRFSSTWAPRKIEFSSFVVFFFFVNLGCEILFSELNFHLILICLLQFECRRGPVRLRFHCDSVGSEFDGWKETVMNGAKALWLSWGRSHAARPPLLFAFLLVLSFCRLVFV